MATLYEIDQAIMACIDMETGEVFNPEALDALFMERSQKIENVALWIKNLQSDALAYKAEKEAFAEREKAAINKIERLKNWLAWALEGQKFSTAKCAVSFRKSEQVEIFDENAVDDRYWVSTVLKRPDKAAIKTALKNGEDVVGCKLVENVNAQIK